MNRELDEAIAASILRMRQQMLVPEAAPLAKVEALQVRCLCCGDAIKPRQVADLMSDKVMVRSEHCTKTELKEFSAARIAEINAAGGWTAFLS